MKLNQSTILGILLLFVTVAASSQTQNDSEEYVKNYLGFSVQVYPAGIIPTINYEHYVSENASFIYRLGVNIIDRQDFSDENDEEDGFGVGGTVGYRKYFPTKNEKGNFMVAFNTDVYNLWIDYENDIGQPNEVSGTSTVWVLQPWLEGGYFINLKDSNSQIGMTAGFGREINVITNGRDVAQDFIGSLSIQYKFGL